MKKLLILLLILSACHLRPEEPTIVTGMKYTPAYTTVDLVYNAALKMSLPETRYYPDSYTIHSKSLKTDETYSFNVSKEMFYRTNIGDTLKPCK